MKNRLFLAYLPLMLAVGVISIWFADKYNGRIEIRGYRADKIDGAFYDGDELAYDQQDKKQNTEDEPFNGSELRDNGKPYAIKVNKLKNVVTVYELSDTGIYNKPVKAMICSVGESGNTPEGTFELGEGSKWLALFGDCYGQYAVRITGNILFHSVPYYTHDKSDLEVEEYNKLGESVSAGCVRLTVIDAKWIFENCEHGTLVEIFSSEYDGPMGKPVAVKIEDREGANWDPTDPDVNNPYMEEAPLIMGACDRVIKRYSDFDIAAGVSAVDKDGNDITRYIKISGKVDGDTCGDYPVTYTISVPDAEDEGDENGQNDDGNSEGNEEQTSVTVHFVVKDDESPVLEIHQVVDSIGVDDIASGKKLLDRLRQNVDAYDDGEQMSDDSILVDYSEVFDTVLGTRRVKYRAKDIDGNYSDIVVLSVAVDLEVPTLKLKNELQREISKEKALDDDYLLSLVEADDNSGEVELKLSRPLICVEGEPYKVMYYAKDAVGNVTTLNVTFQLK